MATPKHRVPSRNRRKENRQYFTAPCCRSYGIPDSHRGWQTAAFFFLTATKSATSAQKLRGFHTAGSSLKLSYTHSSTTPGVLSYAFQEKAGRSQVGSLVFALDKFFSLAGRHSLPADFARTRVERGASGQLAQVRWMRGLTSPFSRPHAPENQKSSEDSHWAWDRSGALQTEHKRGSSDLWLIADHEIHKCMNL
jgi:hypothetical protein